MGESSDELRKRSKIRRATWKIGSLDDPLPAPATFEERLRLLESLRRAACALAGTPYPNRRSTLAERRLWPIERIA